jgi:hypothetical protein
MNFVYFVKQGGDVLEVLLFTEDTGFLEEDDERSGSTAAEKQGAEWRGTYTLIVWTSSCSFLKRRLVMIVKMLVLLVWMIFSLRTMMIAQ